MKKKFKPVLEKKWCKSCGICVKVCPVKNLEINEDGLKIGDKCTGKLRYDIITAS